MVVTLINDTFTFDSLSYIPIYSGSSYRSTKTVTKGSWYFEFTYLTGTKQCVIGFSSDLSQLALTREKKDEYFQFYFYRGGSHFTFLDMKVSEDSFTAGIGFDIKSLSFFIQVNNESRVIDASQYFEPKKAEWNVLVRQRGADYYVYDEVSLAFEKKDFKYFVPFGFTPWAEKMKILTCIIEQQIKLRVAYFCIFLL